MLVLSSYSQVAVPYDPDTHKKLSERAYSVSELGTDPNRFASLGLNGSETFPDSTNKRNGTAGELFGIGAQLEDDNIRPLNHFFNPLSRTSRNQKGNTIAT